MIVYIVSTVKYGIYTGVYDDLIEAVNMPYTIWYKYGRNPSAWITVKYGKNTVCS